MRVNPYYISNLVDALGQTALREQQLSAELSSGIKVNSLADDPVAAGQSVALSDQLSRDDTFTRTVSTTQGLLQVTDSALGGVVSQVNSAISLATQGNNGTLNASDLKSIALQIGGIRDEVLALANTTYQGQYVFAGSKGGTAAPFTLDNSTTPATVAYSGDSQVRSLVTPNGQTIPLNLPGGQVFQAAGHDLLGALNNLEADFSSGTASPTAAADLAQLTDALGYLSSQRVSLGNSMNRLTAAASYTQQESLQLKSAQANLVEANMGQVATGLSQAETQATALSQVIAKLGKGSLFDYM